MASYNDKPPIQLLVENLPKKVQRTEKKMGLGGAAPL